MLSVRANFSPIVNVPQRSMHYNPMFLAAKKRFISPTLSPLSVSGTLKIRICIIQKEIDRQAVITQLRGLPFSSVVPHSFFGKTLFFFTQSLVS